MRSLTLNQQGVISTPGEFAPTDVANLLVWLDATDITTLWTTPSRTVQITPGQDVGAWDDLSGNGNHFERSTTSQRPTYVSNFNTSYQGIHFDGNDSLVSTPALSEVAQDYTFFFVTDWTSTGDYLFDNGPTRFVCGYSGVSFGWHDGTWRVASKGATGPCIVTYRFNSTDATSAKCHVNQVQHLASVYNPRALGTRTVLAGKNDSTTTYGWRGHIASFLLYTGNVSEGEIAQIETYLANKHGISL